MSELTLTANGNHCQDVQCERRAAVRHLCALDTLYQRGGGRLDLVWWIGRIRNLSAHGIGLSREVPEPKPWRRYANDPARFSLAKRLVPEIRAHLKRSLPSSMIPGATMLTRMLSGPSSLASAAIMPPSAPLEAA